MEPPSDQERNTAALSYLFFPLAISVLVDVGIERRSEWARGHARHALVFGCLALLFLFVIATIPLIIVTSAHLSTTGILVLYSIAFAVDIIALTAVSLYGIRRARMASRGTP